ncbi:hypothetical protein C8R47DRAFT_1072183 [Mycena vitilis]|nr:hypothetical protein C8R47DRAFT_1072183 [Mycena vitilis]
MLDMTTVALQLPLHTPTVSAWFYSTSHSALPAPRTHPPRRQRVQSDGSDPSIPSPSPSSSRSAAQRTQARDVSAIAHTRRRRRDGTRHPARDPASSSCENDPPATAANALACGRLSRDIKGQGSPKKEVQRQSHMLARRTYTWSCVRYSLVRNSPRGRGNSDRDGAAAEGVVACAAAVSARVQRINSSAASLLETRGLQVRGSGRGRIPIEDDGVVDEGEDEARGWVGYEVARWGTETRFAPIWSLGPRRGSEDEGRAHERTARRVPSRSRPPGPHALALWAESSQRVERRMWKEAQHRTQITRTTGDGLPRSCTRRVDDAGEDIPRPMHPPRPPLKRAFASNRWDRKWAGEARRYPAGCGDRRSPRRTCIPYPRPSQASPNPLTPLPPCVWEDEDVAVDTVQVPLLVRHDVWVERNGVRGRRWCCGDTCI